MAEDHFRIVLDLLSYTHSAVLLELRYKLRLKTEKQINVGFSITY